MEDGAVSWWARRATNLLREFLLRAGKPGGKIEVGLVVEMSLFLRRDGSTSKFQPELCSIPDDELVPGRRSQCPRCAIARCAQPIVCDVLAAAVLVPSAIGKQLG